MHKRIMNIPQNKSFFLFSHRGTGKTTWVKSNFPDALYIDLLEAGVYNELLANPQRLGKMIVKMNTNWITIDEVQRVPELSNEVHRLIEAEKYHFILTGSSARKLRAKGNTVHLGCFIVLSHPHPNTLPEGEGTFNSLPFKGRVGVGMG